MNDEVFQKICAAVSRTYGMPLFLKTRQRPILEARQMAMVLCEEAGMTQEEIGFRWGFNRSNMVNTRRRVKSQIETEPRVKSLYQKIKTLLEGPETGDRRLEAGGAE